ncbi:unnamed protein product [Vitrella brassicaformis CCMP3155]|uniref:ubiquitinyl hydrolase 1 n=2 Tax=Vitrella brassicaformis TaxID=1169539 RepID=A0A0G4GV10_VITBC|nr:unnamed protein product [Vitrella brassicaformis CCMP3155]|mmetsp:Transcript_16526/g.39671  ORF Transcript_16526/g.39671 Transcript_16526/m.39671 type:complete len:586 (+) Transcript_16526:87-1844(+)|eukprot:CEM34734.1 unnamed protein product [Vitrella brassicaformis CCMP3155]
MPSVKVQVKWGKQVYNEVEVETSEPGVLLKTQLWTLTGVPVERMKLMGTKGIVKDDTDLAAFGLKDGSKLTLIGTAEGKELQPPSEKTVFVEDLTPAQKAKLLKEKQVEPLPMGLVNLGTTCYVNSVVQFLKPAKEFTNAIKGVTAGGGPGQVDPEMRLTASFRDVYHQLEMAGEPIPPMLAIQNLRDRFPQFAQRGPRGVFMQQDAEECLNALLNTFRDKIKGGASGSDRVVDKLFSFTLSSTYKCLENEKEEETTATEETRKLSCHMGNQLHPVSLISQGIKLSLDEDVEKMSPTLGKNAAYKKTSRMETLPEYLTVHFVRFEWKGASAAAGTEATKAKVCRRVEFSRTLDAYEFCSKDLQRTLRVGRKIQREKDEEQAALRNKALEDTSVSAKKESDSKEKDTKDTKDTKDNKEKDGDVKMTDGEAAAKPAAAAQEAEAAAAAAAPEKKEDEIEELVDYDTGNFQLLSIITHQGRAADSGHYIAWVRKTEDEWLKFDDDKVSDHKWKDIDLTGGRNDYHIAYLLLLKKLTVKGPKDAKVEDIDEEPTSMDVDKPPEGQEKSEEEKGKEGGGDKKEGSDGMSL